MPADHKIRFSSLEPTPIASFFVIFNIRHKSLLSLTNQTSWLSHCWSSNDSICITHKAFLRSKHIPAVKYQESWWLFLSYWYISLYFRIFVPVFLLTYASSCTSRYLFIRSHRSLFWQFYQCKHCFYHYYCAYSPTHAVRHTLAAPHL